jgi:cupin superfamily acireductone dioxygenase involved in methionine salvage
MVVDHNFQNIKYDINKLLSCPFPVVRLDHNFENILLSWEEIVETTNKYLINNSGIKHMERGIINYQIKKIKLQKLKPVEDLLKSMYPEHYHDTDLYGSYENSTGGFKLHDDPESTILHVQKGEVIINVVTGSMSYVFNMKQNDMIYIKKGIKHAVIGLTPRFLTSYGILSQG